MAPQNLNEVFNFVNKFLNLRKNGEKATLSLECQDGSVSVNLHLHLPSYPPPRYEPHQPPRTSPCSRPSPSRVRRSKRRADARAHAAAKSDIEQASQAHAPQIPAEQADTDITRDNSSNQVDYAEEALRNTIISGNFTDDIEGNDAEEASDKEKPAFNHSEANTAAQADLPADDLKENCDIEILSENCLVCNYCDQGFENEEVLRNHTEIEHGSRRIRYRRI